MADADVALSTTALTINEGGTGTYTQKLATSILNGQVFGNTNPHPNAPGQGAQCPPGEGSGHLRRRQGHPPRDGYTTSLSPTGVPVTALDNDAPPEVTLSLDSSIISENGGTATVSAELSRPLSAATTIKVTSVPGAYTVGSDATIMIAAGATTDASDTATITAVYDSLHQGSAGGRSTTVTGTAANTLGAGTVTGAALTLTEDESAPTVALSLYPSSISEGGGVSTVTATLSALSAEATTITVSSSPVASTGAVSGDFTLTGTTLTIADEQKARAEASATPD